MVKVQRRAFKGHGRVPGGQSLRYTTLTLVSEKLTLRSPTVSVSAISTEYCQEDVKVRASPNDQSPS